MNDEMGAAGRLSAVADGVPPRPQMERVAGRLLRVEVIEIAWSLMEKVDGQNTPRTDVDVMDVFDRLQRAVMRHATATKSQSVSR